MTPHDFLKYIPATNCGECGYAACLAFAVAVTKGGITPDRCPYLDKDALPVEFGSEKTETGLKIVDRGQDKRDMALVAHLKSKVQSLDFSSLSRRLDADWSADSPKKLRFLYLDHQIVLSADDLIMDDGRPVDPRDQILLYNYVSFGGGATAPVPDGTWLGMESLPNSIAKVRTLSKYCEQRLAERFSGRADQLAALCDKIMDDTTGSCGSADNQEQNADVAEILPVLPRVPLYLLFWDQDEEDGFEARVKILFDHQVMEFLDLESLVFAAERTADRLLELDC